MKFLLRLTQCLMLPAAAGLAAYQLMHGELAAALPCLLFPAALAVPPLTERLLQRPLPGSTRLLMLGFFFGACVLGEGAGFYVRFPVWDSLLHALSGMLFAALGMAALAPERLSFRGRALAGFCIAVTAGVLWEFAEFAADRLLLLDMQKDTLLRGFQSVLLDPAHGNHAFALRQITRTVIETADGSRYVLAGYLDPGLTDTVKDLFVTSLAAGAYALLCCKYQKNFMCLPVESSSKM